MDESPRSVAERTSDEVTEDSGAGVYDALAELFLGEDEPVMEPDRDAPRDTARTAAPRRGDAHGNAPVAGDSSRPAPGAPASGAAALELLVLGHLPVYAGPWAAQYAGAVASQQGAPAALVRLLDGQLSLDLVGQPPSDVELPVCHTLEEAIGAASQVARRWIVRLDPVSEASIATRDEVGIITVLTGADEAATVGAYRAVKGVSEAERLAARAPVVQVAIMGAEGEAAEAAWTRLRRAVRSFLETPLTRAPGVARLGPITSRTLYRGEATTSEELVEALGAAGRAAPGPEERAHAGVAASVSSVAGGGDVAPPREAGGEGGRAPSGAAQATAVEATPRRQGGGRSAMDAPPTPPAEHAGGDRGSSDLAGLVGLTALRACCPRDEGVQLAVDADGRLHLVAADEPRAAERLMAVAGWARVHERLLAAAEPAVRPGGEPTLHIVTADPSRGAGLSDSGMRLHLRISAEDARRGAMALN